ncbi:hypothetical protein KSS87_017045 [Heliosperma pusillum]|nr:hypothetical protein KSS87_017045 [Heliosperma pusillum]
MEGIKEKKENSDKTRCKRRRKMNDEDKVERRKGKDGRKKKNGNVFFVIHGILSSTNSDRLAATTSMRNLGHVVALKRGSNCAPVIPDPIYASKRRVPSGPDPIHNRGKAAYALSPLPSQTHVSGKCCCCYCKPGQSLGTREIILFVTVEVAGNLRL